MAEILPIKCPLAFHPLAEMFPLMEGAEFAGLVASVKTNDLRDPIVMFEQKILDGRNRYRACLAAKVDPKFIAFSGSDPLKFVIDHNLHRRHLSTSQRAIIAGRLANAKKGERNDLERNHPRSTTVQDAADLLNVGRDVVVSAMTVLRHGTPEEIKAIECGDATASTIARQLRRKLAPGERKQQRQDQGRAGKNPARIQNQRLRAQILGQLKDALINLTSLPLPSDVAEIVRAHSRSTFINDRLLQAHKWLEEFLNEWTGGKAHAENGITDNHAVARKSDRTA